MTKKPSIGSALASMKAKQSTLDMRLDSVSSLGLFSAKRSALYEKMSTVESLGIGSSLAYMKSIQPTLDMTLAANSVLGLLPKKQASLYGKISAIESLGIGNALALINPPNHALNWGLASYKALASFKAIQPDIYSKLGTLESLSVRNALALINPPNHALDFGLASCKALASFKTIQPDIYSKLGSIESLGIGSVLESFKASQNSVSVNIAAINSMIIMEETLVGKDLSVESCVKIEEGAVEAACEVLSECSEETSFKDAFEAFPTLIQLLIWRTFLYLLLPIFISVTANLLTPYIKSYIEGKINFSQKISMNQIKRIPDKAQIIDAASLRFISGGSVRLRRSPSTSSEILDEMVLGQVVTVLSKKRNWIEVMYEYDDGEVLTGWVFTRYAKRFHR